MIKAIGKTTNSPWLAAIIVALLYLVLLRSQLAAHGHTPTYFITIGDKLISQADELPPHLYIWPDSYGYDGQFFYQLALNPFTPQEVNAGLLIDNAPYRHQRLFYPLTAWLLALGQRDRVPAAMLLANYLALVAIAWLGAHHAQQNQAHALWGCLFALYSGFIFSFMRDLSEIMVVLFLLAGFLTWRQARSGLPAGILLTLAILTRETALLAVLALALAMLLKKEHRRWPVVILPLATFAIWQAALYARWGQLPILAGGQNLGLPLQGLLTLLRSLHLADPLHRIWLLELLAVAVVTAAAAMAWRVTGGNLPQKLAWLAYGLLALSLTHHVWVEDIAFMRAMSEYYLFGLLLIAGTARRSLLLPTAIATITSWLLVYPS